MLREEGLTDNFDIAVLSAVHDGTDSGLKIQTMAHRLVSIGTELSLMSSARLRAREKRYAIMKGFTFMFFVESAYRIYEAFQ